MRINNWSYKERERLEIALDGLKKDCDSFKDAVVDDKISELGFHLITLGVHYNRLQHLVKQLQSEEWN